MKDFKCVFTKDKTTSHTGKRIKSQNPISELMSLKAEQNSGDGKS